MLYRKDLDFFLGMPVRSKAESQKKSVAPGDQVDLAHAAPLLEVLKEEAAHVEQEMAGSQPDAPAMPPDVVAESTHVPAVQMADRLEKALLQRDEAKKTLKAKGVSSARLLPLARMVRRPKPKQLRRTLCLNKGSLLNMHFAARILKENLRPTLATAI